jgi:hypothetical protein
MDAKNNKKPKKSVNILNLSGIGPVIRTAPLVDLNSDSDSDSVSESSVDFGTDSDPETVPVSGGDPGTRLGTNAGPRLDSKPGPAPRESDTGSEPISESATKPHVPAPALGKRKRRSRKQQTIDRRSDFVQHLGYLGKEKVAKLDKLRDDLEEAIAKVVRVHGAYAKGLNELSGKSARVKHIIDLVGEVPYHCAVQRQLVGGDTKEVLEIHDAHAQRQRDKRKAVWNEFNQRQAENRRALGITFPEDLN